MDRWSPTVSGTDYEMSMILGPLTPFRQHLTIISGLRNKPAETPEPHGYIEATWLSGERKKRLAGDFQRDPSWGEVA